MKRVSFEVIPHRTVEPFVLDVPVIIDDERGYQNAARRAYFAAMALLSQSRLDIEDFDVYEFEDEKRGRKVTMAGVR